MLKLNCLLFAVISIIVFAVEPTLDIKFDKAQTLAIGNEKISITGDFTPDGYLKFGKKGIGIPAKSLLSTKGSILVDFRMREPVNEKTKARNFVTLRNGDRLMATIYTLMNTPRQLYFYMFDMGEQNYNPSFPGTLQNDMPYQAGFSYDGNYVRLFLNGKQIAEHPQKSPFDDVKWIYIGPFQDHVYDPSAWDDDCEIKRLRVYDQALSANEMFAESGLSAEKLIDKLPPVISVPHTQSAVTIDGKMDEDAWKHSASLPMLIDGVRKDNTWLYPENRFNLTWDESNLYLGTRTVFPNQTEVKAGVPRDAAETDVWGYESWELYLMINGQPFRFGGNVAGGFVESYKKDASFNGKWTYKSSYKMRIDNRYVWESESAIPWKTLGLTADKLPDISFNYCRSWFLPELSSWCSLTESGDYLKTEEYPTMRLVTNTATMQSLNVNNPTTGRLEQELLISGEGKALVKIQLANSLDLVPAKTVFEKELQLTNQATQSLPISTSLSGNGYDLLIYSLYQNGTLASRQLLPYYLAKNYLKISPNLLHSKIDYDFNQEMFLADYPDAKPVIELHLADDSLCSKQNAQATGTFAFDRNFPKGNCSLELVDENNGKKLFVCSFLHPGIGEWEKLVFDNRIIPPFEPQFTTAIPNGASISVWGRVYTWKNSLFPISITSQNAELLNDPIVLEVNGHPVNNAHFTLGKAQQHRTDFTATAENDDCRISLVGWIEYDGVNYNTLSIHAKRKIDCVKLKLKLPAEQAKFLHTAMEYYWGNKITEKISSGYSRQLGFFPVVWIGEYEKGLCLFSETNNTWNNRENSCLTLYRNDHSAELVAFPCQNLPAGTDISLEFGLLASPVKPLPKNYPLNTFADYHEATMNRPGKTPTANIMLSFFGGYDSILGDFYADVPSIENSVNAKYIHPSVDLIHNAKCRSIPYIISRNLTEEYPEIKAYGNYWQLTPGAPLDYVRENIKYVVPEFCPTTSFSAYQAWKILDFLKRIPSEGIYYDGGVCGFCNNKTHGCNHRIPLLATRELYRRTVLVQLMAGIKEPVLVLHNTDCVQLPAFTFATHLFNGEQIRQDSSTLMHDGKDILDTYDTTMFASELSSLPFGITNSVYQSNDILRPEHGGNPDEDPELYKFRITKPMLAGALVHNTIPSLSHCHFGLFDKVVRAYADFNVPEATFLGYWKAPAKVIQGKDIYVSIYKHRTKPECLAVIAHIGKEHLTQNCKIQFDLKKLELEQISSAKEIMSAEDKEYNDLFSFMKNTKLEGGVSHQIVRTPIKWTEPGVKLQGFTKDSINIQVDFHSFAIVKLK